MISYLGNFAEDATVYIMFNTFSSDDPSASCTITNFINTDVHIHKDDGLTQRNNAAGITVSVDFDGITGAHMVKIDTSDDTVGGFWVVGHEYFVRIEGTTIDGATINSVIGQFSIENRFNEVDVVKWLGTAAAAPTVAGVPEVDMTYMAGGAQTVTDLKDFADAGYDPATNKVQGVVLVDTTTTNTDLVSAADVVNEWETQSQADPTGFHVNVKEVNGTAQTANDNSADINAILGDTNELQIDWVNGGRLDLILDIIAADTTTDIPALIAALNNISTAQVKTEVDTALSDIHLDHLLAADYDPAAKPGVATALLNELIESDGGISRYTANALEQAPITDVSALATSAALSTHDGKLDTADANIDTLLTRVTATVALASALATAQTDLDTITGTDGVTLATAQALYAPNKVIPDVAGTAAGLHSTTDGKVDAVQTDSTAIKAKTDNLPSGIAKNVALPKFDIYMVLSSDHVTSAIGKTITGQISKDGGAFAGITNVISEVGNGMYTIASGFTQTEMNADVITLKFTGTDCDQRIITIYTS